MSVQLRVWQQEALAKYIESVNLNERTALWEATPGAGKTTAALMVCLHQLRRQGGSRVIVVVPTSHLRNQWAKAAAQLGLQLDSNFGGKRGGLTSDFHGVVVTYQQIGRRMRFFQTFAENAVVVLDEVHHAGDGLTWGDSLRIAFRQSRYILCLSGTAFRSDNNAIPYVRYDPEGMSVPDYVYSYSQAIEDGVCRPSAFFTYGGEVAWSENDREQVASFSDAVDSYTAARRLRAALDASSGWIEPMLVDAHQMLLRVRREQPDAGGLLVASDQTHARELAELLAEIANCKPTVVLSDDGEAARKLKNFGSSNQPWLVACNMVSEGVDIPRLRIGVYATTTRTKMYFRQLLGRIVRKTRTPEGMQVAYCYLPADPALRTLAEEVENESRHCLNKPIERFADERDETKRKEPKDGEQPNWQPLSATNSGVDAVIVHGSQISLFGGGGSHEQVLEAVHREVEVRLDESRTRSEEKATLATEIKKLVGLYHRRSGMSHSAIHTQLNHLQNLRSQAHCTEVQLRQRIGLLEDLLKKRRLAA